MLRSACFLCATIMLVALAGCGAGHSKGGGTPTPAAEPTFSPVAGTYTSPQSVSVSDATSGATIYYTADGSNPTSASMLYKGPITVKYSQTLRAVAVAGGSSPSLVGSASYAIVPPLSITTTTAQIPSGTVGSAYAGVTLFATGGVGPYTWSVSSDSLPPGLSLNASSGTLTGTPSSAGVSSFTIQVVDSEPTPMGATLVATITISVATLAINTTSLPAGTDEAAYSQTLAVSGGQPPFTWSVGTSPALPAGLSLAARTGTLSGTPTGVSATSQQFMVTDSAMHTAAVSLQLIINPAPGIMPTGRYTFLFSGTSPQGSLAMIGTFTLSGSGNPYTVSGGQFDENTNANATPAANATPKVITGGTLTNGTDGLGTLVLTTASGSIKFALAVPKSISTSGSDAAVRMIEFDDATGAGTRGSGVMKVAQPNPVLPPAGPYAFLVSGAGNGNTGNQPQHSLVGSFQTDALGNITSGVADALEGGTGVDEQFTNLLSSTAMSVDADGRGSLSLVLQAGSTTDYVFYQVSASEWFIIALDPPAVVALSTGVVLAQTGAGSFSSFSLPSSQYGYYTAGLTQLDVAPDVTAGILFSNGGVSLGYDEYVGGSVTYNGIDNHADSMIDPYTGRVVVSFGRQPLAILYLIDSNRAFLVGAENPANTSSSAGFAEAQSGSALANAALSGSYAGGSVFQDNAGVLNENGIITADGNGNITFTTNRSTAAGLVQYQNVTGTYNVVGYNGRVEVTLPDGLSRVIYIVSPNRIVYLTIENAGYVGVFEQ